MSLATIYPLYLQSRPLFSSPRAVRVHQITVQSEGTGFESKLGQEIVLFSRMSRGAVGPTHPPA
jgi:hypothetical protein